MFLSTRRRRPRRVLALGVDERAIPVLAKVWDAQRSGLRLTAACPSAQALSWPGAPDLADVDAVLVSPARGKDEQDAIIRLAQESGKDVYLVPGLAEISLRCAGIRQLDDLPLLRVRPLGLSAPQLLVKRAFDLVVATALLVPALLVMGIVATLVKATSIGPVLIRQERVGRGGRPFTMLKFRTMVHHAEDDMGPVFCQAHDPRVTPLGHHLRALRLDEFPQLLNVLRGDMSLVGPRPERPPFVERFEKALPDYHLRHLAPSGVTGLGQIAGRYGTRPEDKLLYDLLYIRHYSLVLDIHIILQTLKLVISAGAEHGLRDAAELPEGLQKLIRDAGQDPAEKPDE